MHNFLYMKHDLSRYFQKRYEITQHSQFSLHQRDVAEPHSQQNVIQQAAK